MITTIEIYGSHRDIKVRKALHGIEHKLSRGQDTYIIRLDTRNAWQAMGKLMAEGLLPA